MHAPYSFLALGDSYTVGEAVALHQSFPYQTVRLLREASHPVCAPEVVARTGWTTGELEAALAEHRFLSKYDFVTLLIGVNNQYRGREIIEYKEQFEHLLKRAIGFAGNKPEHVFVLAIPDYGLTPFARRLDAPKISHDLEAYNALNKALSIQFKTQYLDPFAGRQRKIKAGSLAADGLHPSEKEYARWAKLLAAALKKMLKK